MRALFIVRNLASAEPMGLMHLAAVLRQAGHSARLVGARTTPLAAVMDSCRPDLVGYTACTGTHRYMLKVNRFLKSRWSFVSVFGGPHPTFFPEMIHEDGVDAVCRGEGEGAILDIARAIDQTSVRPPDTRPLVNIPNLWVKTPDGIHQNPLRPLIGDLDALPFADRTIRYEGDPASRGYPVKSFLVSRGCPFGCTYCFNSGYATLYGPCWHRVRTRSAGNVIEEIRQVAADGPLDFVQFRESVFPWQEEWLEEFADRYPREIGVPFYCHVRADLLTERRVRLMRRAGCHSVNLGIECGDETYRREVLGRPMSDDQIVNACRMLKGHEIAILSDNMLGLPGAPPDADDRTLRLNQRCGVDYALAMIFQPYPGTALGRRAVELGLFDGDFDRIDYNYYLRSSLLLADGRARRRMENLHKFFALLVEAPWLERFVRPLLDRPTNAVFLSIFRAWYVYAYGRRIVPHRLVSGELGGYIRTLFGRYTPEVNRELAEEAGSGADGGGGDSRGDSRRAVHPGVQPDG